MTHVNRFRRGYTIIELLVVISIIALLASLLMGGVMAARGRGAVTRVTSLINSIQISVASYESEFGDYPPGAGGIASAELLYQCLSSRKWAGRPDFSKDDLADTDGNGVMEIVDHWGAPLSYYHHRSYRGEPRASSFRVVSAGPDGKEGTPDDITNYD